MQREQMTLDDAKKILASAVPQIDGMVDSFNVCWHIKGENTPIATAEKTISRSTAKVYCTLNFLATEFGGREAEVLISQAVESAKQEIAKRKI